MSAVPILMQWTNFVKTLGGLVILDLAWSETATAEFPDDADGALNVVAHLDDNGDLDVTRRPKLEGEKIRGHAQEPSALAAFAWVNPGTNGNGEPVSREAHHGAWKALNEDLAIAQAKDGTVGGVEVGGRGPFLVHKGRLWLPNGPQQPPTAQSGPGEPRDHAEARESASEATDAKKHTQGPTESTEAPREAPATPEAAPQPDAKPAPSPPAPRRSIDAAVEPPRRPRQNRQRIFGDEADDLIHQARSAGRRRA